MHESPFQLLVSDLIGHPGASRTESFLADLPISMDLAKMIGPVEVEVRIDATSHEIVTSGTAHYRMITTCNRCLAETEEDGTARFSQIYRMHAERDDTGEDAEAVLAMDKNGWIDLESPIRDEVGLALPLKPLCRTDCLGLCPTCGTDLNTDPCEGHEDLSSSPFAVLERFLDPQD